MAETKLSDHQSQLAQFFQDQVVPQFNRSTPLLQILPTKKGQGKNCAFVARTGTAAGTPIADGADVSTYNADTKVPATLPWAEYHDAFNVSGRSIDAAFSAGNPGELADLLGEQLMEASERLAVGCGTDIYTGDPSATNPEELAGLVDPTNGALLATGTYATIVKGTTTQFQGNELANGGIARSLSLDLMRRMRTTISQRSGKKPDLIVCGPATHEQYGKLFGNERRYLQDVRVRGMQIALDGGYQVLEFDGIPVIDDIRCPEGELLFLNSSVVGLRFLPWAPVRFGMRRIAQIPIQAMPEERLKRGDTPILANLVQLATTGNAMKMALYVTMQLVVEQPGACGRLKDIAY